MSLRFIDSFDHYATADFPLKYNSNNGGTISAGTGRRGAAYNAGAGGYLTKTLDAQATWIAGIAFKPASLGNGRIFVFTDGASTQVDIRLKSDGNFQATRNGTLLGTTTVPISAGVYCYLEMKVKIHSSTGTVDLHVNGVSVLSLSAQNTQVTGNATANGFYFGNPDNAISSPLFDDLYVCDGQGSVNNTFLGDCRVDAFLPTGNGSNSHFTNSAGNSTNNYTYVNEALQDGDTTYVADATVGDIDSYAITGITYTPSSIFGVQTNLIAKKDDVGARQIAPLLYRSATAYPGTGVALSTSYLDLMQIYENDPATSAAWTKTNFNATEFGEKVTA